jgi:anti-sigma B factor antagonist
MDYSLELRDDAVLVRVDGRVDESTWESFGAGLSEAIHQAGQSNLAKVIIDLTDLDYMSSRGLRVLTVAKRQGDEVDVAIILASPNEVMREILAISRYDKLFTVIDAIDANPTGRAAE